MTLLASLPLLASLRQKIMSQLMLASLQLLVFSPVASNSSVAVSQPCCWHSKCVCLLLVYLLASGLSVSHQLLDCLLLPMSLLLQAYLMVLASLLLLTSLIYALTPTLLLLAPCYFNYVFAVARLPAVALSLL